MAGKPRNRLKEEGAGIGYIYLNIILKAVKKVEKRKLGTISNLIVNVWLVLLFIGYISESKVCHFPAYEVSKRLSSSFV